MKTAAIRPSPMRQLTIVAVLAATLGFAGGAGAHHSFAMFDKTTTISVEGTVKEFQWTNPHPWIEVLVATPNGPVLYNVEGGTLRMLRGLGWTFDTLKPGDKVTIVMNPLRSGEAGGSLVSATLPDGRTLNAS
jgi:hypothetical protein